MLHLGGLALDRAALAATLALEHSLDLLRHRLDVCSSTASDESDDEKAQGRGRGKGRALNKQDCSVPLRRVMRKQPGPAGLGSADAVSSSSVFSGNASLCAASCSTSCSR